MSGDTGLVVTLLDRLTARLPHRTGSPLHEFNREEIIVLTRATLVGISASCISTVIDTFVQILEELSKSYKEVILHPIHVLHSELYILELLAECCSKHWASMNGVVYHAKTGSLEVEEKVSESKQQNSLAQKNAPSLPEHQKKPVRNSVMSGEHMPKPLGDELARRLIDAVKLFSRPISEGSVLPASNILDDSLHSPVDLYGPETKNISQDHSNGTDVSRLLVDCGNAIDAYIRDILEYVSFYNWPCVLKYFKSTLQLAAYQSPGNMPLSSTIDSETNALAGMRLISSFFVDSRKLGIVIQETCGIFLHLRKSFQTTIATALPLLITRWLEKNPKEFVELHERHQRLDGGAETLFDMSNTTIDGSRRKGLLYPFQTCLLFLLPEVFQVASNLRESKNSNISKKVHFLEILRKALRNRNETAIYCLTSILRVARHFPANSDAAILSYALDVQEEVREAVFRRYTTIDVTLTTATFVSLTQLNLESCIETLMPLCLAVGAPQEFKIAVITACMHFAKQSNIQDYRQLFIKVSEFIRIELKNSGTRKLEPSLPTETSISVDIIHSIMRFLHVSPLTLFINAPPLGPEWIQYFEEVFGLFTPFLMFEEQRIRYLAHAISLQLMGEGTLSIWKRSQGFANRMLRYNFWKTSSIVLIAVSEQFESRSDRKSCLAFIHGYLETRLNLLRTVPELAKISEGMTERENACKKLETVFLVSLCSPDIATCQLVTKCISLFCEEASLIEGANETQKSLLPTLHNINIYLEISNRDFRFTGLVAFQKRVRGLLRQIQYPTAGILRAWEISFVPWLRISQQICTQLPEALDEKTIIEWRSYSGFLASLGGACISEQAATLENTDLTGFQWIDKILHESSDDTLLSKYMKQSVHLLASNNVRVREATRELLATELASSLHLSLFQTLETELGALFENPRVNPSLSPQSRVLFAEQAASLLKSIVSQLGGSADIGGALSIDIGALALNFARFLDDMPDTVGVLRVKIKICQFCETIRQKKELLNLRHDVRVRNQLLEVIFNWISRPSSPMDSLVTPGIRADEVLRLQRDLGIASLKALADLTYRLPIQPAEGQTDADTSDLKSQLFQTYFNRFLSLLKYDFIEAEKKDSRITAVASEEVAKIPDLAISALSNLLSANIDVGLKQSLGIGYHEDLYVRTAFVKVLCNILILGSELSNLSDASVNEKYHELLELLLADMKMTIALCDACPSTELDELTISIFNIFDSRGLGFVLLEALIEHEVEQTENEAELLRRNCVATKMLSVYAKWKGALYLRATLQKVLKRLVLTSQDLDLELDPSRTASAEELQKNALQLRVVTKVFIDDICNSTAHIPVCFKKICSIISCSVMKRFPEAKFTAVGAFIFLRFFCPAIVAPDAEGLISAPPSKEMRRGLLLIAKVVQNLANNVLFGAKEPYMFPLNDFLTQNIYRVTTFLREISVAPNANEITERSEPYDFGSCVALHRFLYDHWDHVRQKIVLHGQKVSDDENNKKVPILDGLRKLMTNLGPPPMDISWNRPAIFLNSPPSYSRFQHFMLQNAGRNTEPFISSRAIYDGGESKDGLPMICIVLRNIDTETKDYELLIFGYLKIASRMWHRSFGLLIDATCYNSQSSELQDSLFQKLNILSPSELSKQLSRVYIYNINSAFRKCFRRILRFSTKNESCAFHPKNVEYHLIGSLQDLQIHFHLSQLHLPRETISVVTDTRYVIQPVSRLSRTRGKIEVVIKVGNQYVQVTTTKKQEVFPGLRLHANVNDIFRLSETSEAPAPSQPEDDSAFGLRTENGKIVMYFSSPRKSDVLQAIKGAKGKHGKELRQRKSIERLLRPQDVPGTLLNIAFMNMASTDKVLRLASYNLLCAFCRAFKFAVSANFLSTEELYVPINSSHFIVDISRQLAQSEPQLTVDFLNEFFVGWESFPHPQRPLCLAYMAPWLPGLRTSLIPNEADGDKARDKIALVFRKLIDISISDLALSTTLGQCIWPALGQNEIYVDIFMEEIIKAAQGFGFDDERTEILGSILSSLDTITIRGKLLSRLRKALNRSSLRPTRLLPGNTAWTEICVLLRLCVSSSFERGIQSQFYLPELFHLITMLANTGSPEIRLMVHRLLVNTIHAICTSFTLEESKLVKLRAILLSLSVPSSNSLMNLPVRESFSATAAQEFGWSTLLATEALAALMAEVTTIAASSVDTSNVWRSRWMSLVASTAFQSNPSIQPRAFVVIGCLAQENIDDDFLYQVLVALKSGFSYFMDDHDCEMLIAIITALTKMIRKLPSNSRYSLPLFWLALSLVRLVPLAMFNYAALFLDATIENISSTGQLSSGRMAITLIQGRLPLGDAALQLDDLYGIHFNTENFHFAICASLVKGLTDSATRGAAVRVLQSFLEAISVNMNDESTAVRDQACMPYLMLLKSRSMMPEDKENLWLTSHARAGKELKEFDVPELEGFDHLKDKELLLNASICLIDFNYLEDVARDRGLNWLNRIAIQRPTVIFHLGGRVIQILDEILISCQNAATMDSAHQLLRTLTSNPKFSSSVNTTEMLQEVLEGIGFGGLWRSSTFHTPNEEERQCTALTNRLIEQIIA
ncbi:Neurofibromin [Podosphaera aphanis]|nr:Neurofibromin [Podosphaera aphanis]